MNTGDARPAGKLTPIWESGVDGQPTLVDNAETLAQLGLIARFGPAWFAGVGIPAEPGTTLVTMGGAVRSPGVVEAPNGARIRDLLTCADAPASGWALIGGLAGRWVLLEQVADIGYSAAELGAVGLSRGVSSITVLPPDGCVLAETARLLEFQANAGARQCGPCMFGLPAIAADMAALAGGERAALGRLRRRLPVINGRGGCGHPDGAVTLAASAIAALTQQQPGHLAQHLRDGGCPASGPVVPLTHDEFAGAGTRRSGENRTGSKSTAPGA
jgi:NADH:ubiquinone oxidoreductase subunit F (NADH-binding)